MNKNSRKALPLPISPENALARPALNALTTAVVTLGVVLTTGAASGAAQQAAAPETQTLHVLAGKSVLINLETRVRRVMVSNPLAIDATATSPTQVVVTAKAPGTSSLILWDQAGQSKMLDVLVDVDVSTLRDAIQQAYPGEPVQVQAEEGRVLLSGTVSDPRVSEDLVKMAAVFSKEVINSTIPAPPRHERQILLEVKFAEVDRTKLEQFGFNLFSTGTLNTPGSITTQQFSAPTNQASQLAGTFGQKVGTGSTTSSTGTSTLSTTAATSVAFTVNDLLNIFLFRPDLNLGATIRDLQTKNILEILAEPNLMAISGKPARFLAGGEFPFPVVQGGTNFSAVTIQFRPFGVRLEFTGYIADNNVVRLQVIPEVSTLDFTNSLTISGFTVPAISTRRAETEIELKDGQGFGIAGLLDHRTTVQLNKIPGISDIPVLGQLFRSRSVNRSNQELMVLVTPRIVDPVKAAPPPVVLPKGPVPFLNIPGFDRGLPKGEGAGKTPEKTSPK
ncbi:MAG: type II and III secretion system protein [Acidobacteria bacterium]|nr:MAG: type II and III secretion system protein [Acidobacteriota bacterium]